MNEVVTDDALLELQSAIARAEIDALIAEIDASPAVTWTGPGGVRERLLARRDRLSS